MLAHIANSGPVPLSPVSRFPPSTWGKQLGALDQGPGLDVEGDQLCGDLHGLVGRPAGEAVSRAASNPVPQLQAGGSNFR